MTREAIHPGEFLADELEEIADKAFQSIPRSKRKDKDINPVTGKENEHDENETPAPNPTT